MSILQRIAVLLIRFYQNAISPYFPACCRYVPTCSAYACEAVEKFGFFKGVFLAVKRLLRCHPFHHGGYDPVPDSFCLFSINKRKGI
ncbi:MAG: membrane protein insertion efficiency factor YidD [Treponema sp.]|nr:membrane protein insertion efficiency factor YidD [Treponema sp.]